jgi:hypothetical protein
VTFNDPTQYVSITSALCGMPSNVLMHMLLIKRPVSQSVLMSMIGCSDKTLKAAMVKLQTLGMVARVDRCTWQLTRRGMDYWMALASQPPLPDHLLPGADENEQPEAELIPSEAGDPAGGTAANPNRNGSDMPSGNGAHPATSNRNDSDMPSGNGAHPAVSNRNDSDMPSGNGAHPAVSNRNDSDMPSGNGAHPAVSNRNDSDMPSGNGAHPAVSNRNDSDMASGNGCAILPPQIGTIPTCHPAMACPPCLKSESFRFRLARARESYCT